MEAAGLRFVISAVDQPSETHWADIPYLEAPHTSQLLRSGSDPKLISERLGHSKVSFRLDRYAHLLPGMQEEAAPKIDAALKAAKNRVVPFKRNSQVPSPFPQQLIDEPRNQQGARPILLMPVSLPNLAH